MAFRRRAAQPHYERIFTMSNSTSTTDSIPATSTEAPPPSTSTPSSANSDASTVSTASVGPVSTSSSTSVVLPSTTPSSSTSLSSTSKSSTPQSSTTTPAAQTTSAPSQTPNPSVVTVTSGGSPQSVTTVVRTLTSAPDASTSQSSTSSSSTSTPGLADTGNNTSSGGLNGGGKTAVEVIVPIVAVALFVLAGLFFWRRRKQRKDAEEIRRKEVEEYGYNPNEDPTLPAIGGVKSHTGDGPFEMREDEAGYRGWGTTAAGSSGRKASTTLSGGGAGIAYSEGTSPSHGPISDARSGDTLIGSPSGRPTSGSEEVLGAMGPSASGNRGGDMHRGPSNASSSYSAANRSDASGEGPLPGGAYGAAQYYSGDANYGGPYADTAAGRAEMSGQPVIRDNLARRATRIENPSHFPTQASAGISQNF